MDIVDNYCQAKIKVMVTFLPMVFSVDPNVKIRASKFREIMRTTKNHLDF